MASFLMDGIEAFGDSIVKRLIHRGKALNYWWASAIIKLSMAGASGCNEGGIQLRWFQGICAKKTESIK